jgi:tetrahydromethanopterin S-methyltransferase subunit A
MRRGGSAAPGANVPSSRTSPAREVEAFRRQVEPIPLIGEEHEEAVLRGVAEAAARNPGPLAGAPTQVTVDVVQAREPNRLVWTQRASSWSTGTVPVYG